MKNVLSFSQKPRTNAARREAEGILAGARGAGERQWRLAGQLAMTDVLIAEGALDEARNAALAALHTAAATGSPRRAGKAAERLADIDERRYRHVGALDWLLTAYRHYEFAGCTVGTSRVDKRIRRLRA